MALTIWSWRKWPDPLVDFGRELYIPWQLTRGKVLYRDIATLFGPLSPYLNAAWFGAFGVSLMTLVFANLAILAALVAGIRYLLLVSTDRFTATAGAVATLTVFGFSQYTQVGNYNFVSPYAHEATHGLALAFAVILSLYRGAQSGRVLPYGVGGFCFGLVLLTKIEPAVALLPAVVAGAWATWLLGDRERHVLRLGVPCFLGAALAAPLLFFFYFSRHMSLAAAARAAAGAWTPAATTEIAGNAFYLAGMGLDEPARNTIRMLSMFAGFGLFVIVGCALDRLWPVPQHTSQGAAIGRRVARLALLVAAFWLVPWTGFPRALPLISAGTAVAIARRFLHSRGDRRAAGALLPLVMLSVFALGLLAKMFLNARIYHYGFYLALPATLMLVVAVLWLIPQRLRGAGWRGQFFRSLAALTLAAGMAHYLAISHIMYRAKTLPIGSGLDRFAASARTTLGGGAVVSAALARVERSVPAGSTLVVIPEGVMLNYLARRENPTPHLGFSVPEMLAFGERETLAALTAAKPDYVLVVERDMREYGVESFGVEGYGRTIMDWVRREYTPVDDPASHSDPVSRHFELLRRR